MVSGWSSGKLVDGAVATAGVGGMETTGGTGGMAPADGVGCVIGSSSSSSLKTASQAIDEAVCRELALRMPEIEARLGAAVEHAIARALKTYTAPAATVEGCAAGGEVTRQTDEEVGADGVKTS